MESIIKISTAYVAAQKEMSNAKKDSNNPFFKSKYADLNSIREAVIPVLNNHGIGVLQPTCSIDGRNYVKTILLHESGEYLESLTEILFAKVNDAQAQGSGISYARRYGLQSMVCIGAEDDDANKANEQPKKPEHPKEPTAEESLKVALYDVEVVGNVEDLTKLWNKYKYLQKDVKFSEAVKNRKIELTPKQ